MFSLIIAIISIVLIIVITIATIYFGGSAFTGGSAKGNAATLVSQAQQISGAVTLYQNDFGGALPTTAADIWSTAVDANGVGTSASSLLANSNGQTYLKSEPKAPKAVFAGNSASYALDTTGTGKVTLAGVGQKVCEAVNVSVGLDKAADAAAVAASAYGCVWDATGKTGAFSFKV